MTDFLAHIKSLDTMIRMGQVSVARTEAIQILKTAKKKLPKEAFAPLAQVLRRVGHSKESLDLLFPLVRGRGQRVVVKPTPTEIVEYAMALSDMGGYEEAESLLSRPEAQSSYEGPVYLAFNRFATWNYSDGIEPLTRAVKTIPSSHYYSLIARLNLADALVYEEEFDQATPLLKSVLTETQSKNYIFLFSVALKIQARLEMNQLSPKKAIQSLERAQDLMKQSGTIDSLFFDKWICVMQLKSKGANEALSKTVEALKLKAYQFGHYETFRDLELYWQTALQSEPELSKLYIGTRHSSFRRKILKLNPKMTIPNGVVFGNSTKNIDILQCFGKKQLFSSPANTPHRLLAALSRDFYSPQTLIGLHEWVFPNEFYNPLSSRNKLTQTLFRLRQDLKRNKKATCIVEKGSGFTFSRLDKCGLLVAAAIHDIKNGGAFLELCLSHEVLERNSTVLAKRLGSSLRTAQRYKKRLLTQS